MINWGILGYGRMGLSFSKVIKETSNSKLIYIGSRTANNKSENIKSCVLVPSAGKCCIERCGEWLLVGSWCILVTRLVVQEPGLLYSYTPTCWQTQACLLQPKSSSNPLQPSESS